MPAGRPTKYTKALLDKAREYLIEWKDQGDMIPSHEGMQEYIGLSSTCMYDWGRDETKEEFKAILDECLVKQRRELINKGLSGDFNSNITKLVLGKHGYHDKQDLGSDPNRPIEQNWTVEFINATPESKP